MKRSVGAINYNLVILAALGVGGYYLYQKFFGSGNAQNAANNAAITTTTAQTTAGDIAAATAAGGVQTLSNAEASGIASQLYDLGISGNPVAQSDQDKMVRLVIQANTQLDLLAIESFFSTKNANTGFSLSNIFGTNNTAYDLAGWLNATLDPAHLATVDNYFSQQGIKAYF